MSLTIPPVGVISNELLRLFCSGSRNGLLTSSSRPLVENASNQMVRHTNEWTVVQDLNPDAWRKTSPSDLDLNQGAS